MDRSTAHVIRPDFGETRLDALQRHAFGYFLHETNSVNGLVADKTQPGAPASIAAVGFALAAYPVGFSLAADARLPLRRDGTAAGGFYEWLVMTVMEDLLSQAG